ncbi:MAG: YfiR family protein [Gemmatimonadota bacterium]|nr:YfiR family protein [Gemmatimonadota bacterium]
MHGWWLALLALAPGRLAAQEAAPLEYRIKAAYLLNFARYVEWPRESFDTPASPIRVCVLGTDPFGGALEATLAGRTAQGRPIAVAQVEAPAEARDCHMVFIAGTEWRRRPDVLRAVQADGVLTVGEGDEFTAAGGVLSFVPIERTVRFTVNLARGDDARLRISSRMLALASEVHGRRPEP